MNIAGRELRVGDTILVMGILNVTPDSFSDGGRYFEVGKAVDRASAMENHGADLIDVGGESTRPGATSVTLHEELTRVLPVIERIAKRVSIPISIDTTKAEIAKRAVDAGARIINDTSALRDDDGMARIAANSGAGVILMHRKGTPRDMQCAPSYDDVIDEIRTFFHERITAAVAAGIHRDRILIDPGIGFGKTVDHNLLILRRLKAFATLERPIVVGPSRKSFLGTILDRPIDQRLMGTAAAVAIAAANGASIVRVHDVAEMVQVVRVAELLRPTHPLVSQNDG